MHFYVTNLDVFKMLNIVIFVLYYFMLLIFMLFICDIIVNMLNYCIVSTDPLSLRYRSVFIKNKYSNLLNKYNYIIIFLQRLYIYCGCVIGVSRVFQRRHQNDLLRQVSCSRQSQQFRHGVSRS